MHAEIRARAFVFPPSLLSAFKDSHDPSIRACCYFLYDSVREERLPSVRHLVSHAGLLSCCCYGVHSHARTHAHTHTHTHTHTRPLTVSACVYACEYVCVSVRLRLPVSLSVCYRPPATDRHCIAPVCAADGWFYIADPAVVMATTRAQDALRLARSGGGGSGAGGRRARPAFDWAR